MVARVHRSIKYIEARDNWSTEYCGTRLLEYRILWHEIIGVQNTAARYYWSTEYCGTRLLKYRILRHEFIGV